MDSLNWLQESDGLHVSVPGPAGARYGFLIGNSFINSLLAGTPPIYTVSVLLNGSETEESFLLDISKARPYIDKSNALKFNFNRKTASAGKVLGASVGRYSLSRGECYHDRYLSAEGWQYHLIYNDIFNESDILASASAVDRPVMVEPEAVVSKPVAKVVDDDDDFDLDLTK